MKHIQSDKSRKQSIRTITFSAMLLAVLVVQEQLLTLLPNIQLTVVLIMVYGAILPYTYLTTVIVGYVFLDSMIMGSFHLLYLIPMLIGWLSLAYVSRMIRHRKIGLIIFVAMFYGFYYGWLFIPFRLLDIGINRFWEYLKSDLIFEFFMVVNNVLTVGLLYLPIKRLLSSFSQTE